MYLNTHRTLDAVGILEHGGDDASPPLRLLRVEANQCSLDAQDGDLLTQAVDGCASRLLPVHRLLVVVGGQWHGVCGPSRVRANLSMHSMIALGITLLRCRLGTAHSCCRIFIITTERISDIVDHGTIGCCLASFRQVLLSRPNVVDEI